jgi:hypothetical protein
MPLSFSMSSNSIDDNTEKNNNDTDDNLSDNNVSDDNVSDDNDTDDNDTDDNDTDDNDTDIDDIDKNLENNLLSKLNFSNIIPLKENNDLFYKFNLSYTILITINDHFNKKYRKLNQSKSILELKYKKYKWCNNVWNISIIGVSTILTLIESSKLVFLDMGESYEENNLTQNFFVLSPIFLGTSITGISSFIKFKKYQEHMEEIYILIDKCIGMLAKIKNKMDEIDILLKNHKVYKKYELFKDSHYVDLFCKDVKNIHRIYEKDIIKEFLVVYHETERYINFKDYDKHLHTINKSAYKRHILYTDKGVFYDEYKEKLHNDPNNKKYLDIKNDSLKNKKTVNTSCFSC